MEDMGIETKPKLPLYNLCNMKIKEEVDDPDPPFFTLTSNVKIETDIGHLDIQYFDHSSVIEHNLKTEPEDADGNCVPLYNTDSVPLGETAETSFQVLDSSQRQKVQSRDRSFCCLLCNQSFSVKEACELQMTCEKCLTATSKPIKSNAEGEKGTHELQTRGKSCSVNQNMINHIRTHNSEKSFKCETCGKGFVFKSSLICHMRTHSTDELFKCETCGKGFTKSKTLTDHMRTHTGEKPFKCDTCGKCFSLKCNLRAHMSTHNAGKPFKCETCGRNIKFKSALTRHVKTHTGDTLQN